MNVVKRSISRKISLGVIVAGCFLGFGAFYVMTQEVHMQNAPDDRRQSEIARKVKEQREMFWKVSSTETPIDPGNRIVAVRKIKLNFEDFDAKGASFTNQKDLVEIELFSKIKIPATNAMQYLVIGDKAFPEPMRSGDMHSVFVHLTPAEFGEIKDGAIVSYLVASSVLDEQRLKERYKHGEVYGAKFGRLRKSMISEFPPIVEDLKARRMRISGSGGQIQLYKAEPSRVGHSGQAYDFAISLIL